MYTAHASIDGVQLVLEDGSVRSRSFRAQRVAEPEPKAKGEGVDLWLQDVVGSVESYWMLDAAYRDCLKRARKGERVTTGQLIQRIQQLELDDLRRLDKPVQQSGQYDGTTFTVQDLEAEYAGIDPTSEEGRESARRRYEAYRLRLPRRDAGLRSRVHTPGQIAQYLHQEPYEAPREWIAADAAGVQWKIVE